MAKGLIAACAVLLLTSVAANAKPGVAVSTVNLRAEANTTSEVLKKIPAGSRLDVGDCTEGWCAVTFGGMSGFAIQTALGTGGTMRRTVRRGPPRGYGPDDDFEPVAPGYSPRPPGYVMGPGPGVVYAPGPYYYGPGPYWGPGPGWGWGYRGGYGWRRW